MFKKQIWLYEQEYRAMTPKAAKDYFTWFVGNIPDEMISLIEMVGSLINLDYSPESLGPLEEWFISERSYIELTDDQIREDNANAPDFILQEMLVKRFAPTVASYDLGAKIAIYFGEVFIRNDPDFYWDYIKRPKSDACFNKPVICGFSPPDTKYPAYANTFSWGLPLYSDSPKGTNWKSTWREIYQIWRENKEIYYASDDTRDKLLLQRQERWAKEEKTGELIIMPGSKIKIKKSPSGMD
jgi:hypothetical protein